MNQAVYDVAVVGAGIVGACIAERLQHDGKRVVLIDRKGPGEGCSGGNAGHFATDIIVPLANMQNLLKVPKLLFDALGPLTIKASYLPQLMPWLMRYAWAAMPHNTKASVEALKLLNRPSIERFDALLSRTGLTDLMVKKGALTVFASSSAQRQNAAHATFVRRHGVKVELLSGDETRELEPELGTGVFGALYYPDTAHSPDPYRLVIGLVDAFERNGGKLMTADVRSLDVGSDEKVGLVCDEQGVRAKEVVIACGAWSNRLLNTIGHSVPLETERGYHLMLPHCVSALNRPVVSFERSFVMTPMAKGLRLAGTVELAGLSAPPDYRRANILCRHARELLSRLDERDATRWMGHRPSLPDSLPVIGRSPKHPKVLLAFGHQHLGLTQAAVTADWISELVSDGKCTVDITPFRIERF